MITGATPRPAGLPADDSGFSSEASSIDVQREQLRARMAALESMREDFLHFVCHELRTSLSLMAAATLMDEGQPQVRTNEILEAVRSGYARLSTLTDKALEYLAWCATERDDSVAVTEMSRTVRIARSRNWGLRAHDVAFHLTVPPRPCFVRAEQAHLLHIAQTLLDNALNYSPGEKLIVVTLRSDRGRVTLRVTDKGRGFPPEVADQLCRPFAVLDVFHRQGGTGLNLPIAAAMARAMGGSLSAESQGPGRGATFTLELPSAPVK